MAAVTPFEPRTGTLPRKVTETFYWAGSCLDFVFKGEPLHGHFGVFLVRTPAGIYMVDTGHPKMWPEIERQVESLLGDEPISFIFPTHAEVPHVGLLGEWLRKYPDASVVGDMRDMHLYYPEFAEDRFIDVRAGDALDLGDRKLVFAPAVWRDLPTTLWAYDTKERVLFVADAFGFLHPHTSGHCDSLSSEQQLPYLRMAQVFNAGSLFWSQFTDMPATYEDIDELIVRADPLMIAPAHGSVVDNLAEVVLFYKDSMDSTVTTEVDEPSVLCP